MTAIMPQIGPARDAKPGHGAIEAQCPVVRYLEQSMSVQQSQQPPVNPPVQQQQGQPTPAPQQAAGTPAPTKPQIRDWASI